MVVLKLMWIVIAGGVPMGAVYVRIDGIGE